MTFTKFGVLKLMSALPVVGQRYQVEVDKILLQQLDEIEARFSSPNARFINQLHDLYDCLKSLRGPLEIDVRQSHGFAVAVHTKTSGDAQKLLERLKVGGFINPDEYFTSARRSNFLDWFSNNESVEVFVEGVMHLLHVYCNNNPRPGLADGPANFKLLHCNEVTDHFMAGRYFKLVILDLIQTLTVVLSQRIGG